MTASCPKPPQISPLGLSVTFSSPTIVPSRLAGMFLQWLVLTGFFTGFLGTTSLLSAGEPAEGRHGYPASRASGPFPLLACHWRVTVNECFAVALHQNVNMVFLAQQDRSTWGCQRSCSSADWDKETINLQLISQQGLRFIPSPPKIRKLLHVGNERRLKKGLLIGLINKWGWKRLSCAINQMKYSF